MRLVTKEFVEGSSYTQIEMYLWDFNPVRGSKLLEKATVPTAKAAETLKRWAGPDPERNPLWQMSPKHGLIRKT